MSTTLKRGATRADGYRFLAYEKRGGRLREKWASPERYGRVVEMTKVYRKRWGIAQRTKNLNKGKR